MGRIDTTLRYNGIYNSYEMDPNDTVHASVFETAYLSHVTTQFVAVRVAGTIVDGWIEAIWIDSNGEQVGSTENVTFTPTRLWKRYTHTFEVPETAVKIKITYKSGTEGFHFSCPMTEAGEIASAYNVQVAAQLAYHTAGGSYVGFLNADQIVTGKMLSPDGNAWFDLDKPEIVMKGNVNGKEVIISLSPEMPFSITVDGEQLLYISPRTWKIVTSRADINEDGNVDHLDYEIIDTIMYYGTEYSDFVMDRANCWRGSPGDAEYINSNDMSFVIDNGANGFDYMRYPTYATLEYYSANEMRLEVERNILSLDRAVYPIYIRSPINAITARSIFTVDYDWQTRIYTIILYDPQGGFQPSDEVEIVYLAGGQIRNVGAAPISNPFPGYSPNPLNPPQP